jgi:hypothetical protein
LNRSTIFVPVVLLEKLTIFLGGGFMTADRSRFSVVALNDPPDTQAIPAPQAIPAQQAILAPQAMPAPPDMPTPPAMAAQSATAAAVMAAAESAYFPCCLRLKF